MGVVYEAEDTRLARRVALKFLSRDIEQDPYALERFKQEARAASALNHPNIRTIHAIEECDGQHFIAMELLEGQSLNEKINGHPLPVDKIIDIGIQITDALDVAHSKGIVHRDLKPANIFITTRGQAKILDFGLAKLTYDRRAVVETVAGDAATVAPAHLTMPGTTVGTIAYMSPEQARGEELDGRSDLFSLGAIFYEMATGRIPFEGNTSAVVFQGILDRNPRPPMEMYPAVPFKLEEIISKALEKDVELRYQSAAEIRSDLRRLKRDSTGQSSTGIATAPASYPAARGSSSAMRSSSSAVILDAARRHKSGAGFVLVLSLAMIAAGLYGFYTWISRWLGDSGPVPFQNMSMEKVTNSGKVLLATISPDGKYVVNVTDEGHGQRSLWMRHIATGSNTQIMAPTEVSYSGLTFTPNGDFLYFVQREPDKPGVGFLYQIPLLGGTPHKLVEDVDSAVSFSPDGQQMVYLRNSSSEASSKLILAHADGSGEHVLASLPLPGYSDPAWSIDGKSIAAAVLDPGSQSPGRIVVLNPANGKEKTVYEGTALLQKPTWMPDGRHLVLIFHDISSDWNGQIGAISLGGQKLHRITNDLSVYSNSTLGVTRDGEQLVAIQVTPQAGVYTLSSDASSNSSATEVSNHGNTGGGWLPDGRVKRTPIAALAEDPCQADGGNLRGEPREAERNTQRERGRHADVRHSHGTGSVHPADVVAGHDTDLGATLQRTQLWVPAGAQGSRCRAGRTKVRRNGQGLGRGFGHRQIFRSRQLGHPDGEDRTSDPGQTGVEAHRAVSAGGRHGGRSGGQERGRYAARRAAVSTAGEHLSGRLRSGTGAARTFVQPVRG